MFYCFDDLNIIVHTPPKNACTTVKEYMWNQLRVKHPDLPNHHPHARSMVEYMISERAWVREKDIPARINDRGYKLYTIYRDPYTRFYSALHQKFIAHHPAGNKNLLHPETPSQKRGGEFYNWFKSIHGQDISKITNKQLIDYHCGTYTSIVDPHFTPIFNNDIYNNIIDYKNIIILNIDSNLNKNLDEIFKERTTTFKLKRHNTSTYNTKYLADFNEKTFLENCIDDNRCINKSEYYKSSVRESFKIDFDMYNKLDKLSIYST